MRMWRTLLRILWKFQNSSSSYISASQLWRFFSFGFFGVVKTSIEEIDLVFCRSLEHGEREQVFVLRGQDLDHSCWLPRTCECTRSQILLISKHSSISTNWREGMIKGCRPL